MKGKDHRKGLLRLFILRTLLSRPKSGYDILREIEEKTKGEWSPSKGTIYPILTELEEEGLIEGVEEGARARRAFRTTEMGSAHLAEAVERQQADHRRRMAGRRLLFFETFFDETERELLRLSYQYVEKAMQTNQEGKAIKALRGAIENLE